MFFNSQSVPHVIYVQHILYFWIDYQFIDIYKMSLFLQSFKRRFLRFTYF